MNKYVCFFRHYHPIEVMAETSLEAQVQALAFFRAEYRRKIANGSGITVILAEKAGVPVTHVITS